MNNQNVGDFAPKERILFKKEVKKKMIDLDLSIEELSDKIGYSDRTVRQALGCGNKLSKYLIQAIADELQINLNWIRRKANGE